MIRIEQTLFESSASECMAKVRLGETIVITDGDTPFAEVHPIAASVVSGRRRLGFARGMVKILPSFFDPMSKEELAGWYGE
jgi:antitoxin (DNA-binding transcriptional repressor) of toxin-antitoxin stability system